MPKLNRKKPAAKPKTGKGTGKAGPSAKKTEKRQPQKAPKQREYAPKDLEDVLIGELLSGKEQHMEPRLFLQGLLYNSTESMRQLSYNYGFSIGKNLYSRTSKESIAPLLGVLESAGIGRMLYMPVIDTAIIKSSTRTPQEIEAKNNLHSYEAGLISGYLSAHSSNMIITL
ncbi:MAG TPA: hypothetical protein VL945_02760, partial [Candidatus Saccharimonadales bacterium]|nr:hypothetical protein [Candidatus Saccharimonadales bacterium]